MQRSLAFALVLVACSSSESALPTAGRDAAVADVSEDARADAGTRDAPAVDVPFDPAGMCVGVFGSALTASFGRIDGVVRAVVRPSDTQCAMVNNDHVVVEVTMNAAVYRMVVNVLSTRAGGDPRVRFAAISHAPVGPAWSEGWHTQDVLLDYPSMLGATVDDMTPTPAAALVDALAHRVAVGARVSVYATSGNGRPESAHLVHRNGGGADGAIVLDPGGPQATYLIFSFDEQSF